MIDCCVAEAARRDFDIGGRSIVAERTGATHWTSPNAATWRYFDSALMLNQDIDGSDEPMTNDEPRTFLSPRKLDLDTGQLLPVTTVILLAEPQPGVPTWRQRADAHATACSTGGAGAAAAHRPGDRADEVMRR